MFGILALAFIAVPLSELAVIILVGQQLGVVPTIALLFAVSIAGAWLAKREGLGVVRKVRAQLEAGQVPGAHLVDGLLILVAGALLLTPGFLTDAVALSFLLPPVRAAIRGFLRRRFSNYVEVRTRPAYPSREPGYGSELDEPS